MIDALGVRGKAVTIGSPGQGQKVSINVFDHLVNGRSYVGTHQGDSNPEKVPNCAGNLANGSSFLI
jgi:Zn-dependent alcohol dehydrogenase